MTKETQEIINKRTSLSRGNGRGKSLHGWFAQPANLGGSAKEELNALVKKPPKSKE